MSTPPRVEFIAANHCKIFTDDGTYLQSYRSIVAKLDFATGKYVVGRNWDYSNTTMKYVGQFIGQNTATTRKQIKSGEVIEDLTMN